jgi:protein-tyrosine phosphatase
VGSRATQTTHSLKGSLLPEVLFICTANQFRSPVAAAYFTRKLIILKTPGIWKVTSAGTWTPGNLPAHPKAIEAAKRIELDLSTHRTQEVNAALLDSADLIVCMQAGHKEAIVAEFPTIRDRVILLGSLANIPGEDITDPAQERFAQPDEVVRIIIKSIDKAFPRLVDLAESRQNRQKPEDF